MSKEKQISDEQKFDFTNLGLYFGEGSYPGGAENDDRMAELAANFHEAPIDFYMGTFSNDIMDQAKMYAERAGLANVTVSKNKDAGLGVDIAENGNVVAQFQVDAHVAAEDYGKILPNGDEASMLEYYGWEGYEKLEEAVHKQDMAFGSSVESIQETTDEMEQ